MKKIVLLAAGILLSVTSLCAQTNNTLVVFSEGGERFYLILNGLRQNDGAATNVKAVALNQSVYKAKVIFEQKGIPDADKTMYMTWEGMDASNMEFVYSIKKDKKGKYKWSFVSTAPISASSPYASLQPSYPGGSTAAANTAGTNNNIQATSTNTNTTVNSSANTNNTAGTNTSVGVNNNTSNTNTTVTTTTTTTHGTNDNVNVGMNMNGMGVNMNINISDPLMTGNSQTTTSTTTTTTSGTSTSSTGNPTTATYSATSISTGTGNPNTVAITTNYSDNSYSSMNSNTAAGTCGWAMNSSDFASAKKSIAAKSFEESKLTVAKQILNSNCLNTAQVKEIMDQFTFEETKLDWAKYAYTKTTDRNNYFKINDGFTFEASIDELNDYISKIK